MYEVELGDTGDQVFGPFEDQIINEICFECEFLNNVTEDGDAGWEAGVKAFWADKGIKAE